MVWMLQSSKRTALSTAVLSRRRNPRRRRPATRKLRGRGDGADLSSVERSFFSLSSMSALREMRGRRGGEPIETRGLPNPLSYSLLC